MIKDNFGESVIGRGEKLSAGLIYADTVRSASLAEDLRALGAKDLPGSPAQILAQAISPSPAVVDQSVLESSRALAPAAIVELVTFVAVLQMLHRLSSFYEQAGGVLAPGDVA